MPKKKILGYAVIILLLLPLTIYAQAQEMKSHKVIRGDTLWDISKAELNDPLLWPRIWKENPGIADPHKIYPDQMIRVPLYLIQNQKADETAVKESAAAPAPPEPAVSEKQPDKTIVKEVTPKPAPPSACQEAAFTAGQRYKDIKGIILYDGTVIEGKIICMNAETVKIHTKDDKVLSYSFINEVDNFIK